MEPTQNPNVPKPGEVVVPSAPESSPAPVAPEVAPNSAAAGTPLTQAPLASPVAAPNTPHAPVASTDQPAPVPSPMPTPNPSSAADVDVIEKEWVDQANKIVEQTKDDPYVQEEAVESLQQDYLKKRYGHDVKKPGEQAGT